MTQFLNLKSQAGTSRTQAAQIGTGEAPERKVRGHSAAESPLCKGGHAPSAAPGLGGQPHRKQEGSAGVGGRGGGSAESRQHSSRKPEPEGTVGWEPEEKQDWTGREAAGKAPQWGHGVGKGTASGQPRCGSESPG